MADVQQFPTFLDSRSAAAAIDVEGVARRFGRHWPLRDARLTVLPGEGVALLGRNGSGKTTLLRILATTIRPTRGGGRVCGHDLVKDADLVREHVGVLAHAPGLYPDLTARENLAFAMRMAGEDVDEGAIREGLARVGLAAKADQRVRTFSSGMTRRVALARLIQRPHALLLLDEPYASFDAEGIALLNELLLEARARGAAVVIATHDPERASVACNRMVALEEGRLGEVAPAPAVRQVAR